MSWRKRHPVLSRAVLYTVGALVVAGIVVALRTRQRVDAQDRLDYLTARLGSLDVVLATGEGPAEVLRVLDDEFSGGDLPPALRQWALRLRAQALARSDRIDDALGVLEEARAVAVDPVADGALAVETAEILGLADRAAEGLSLLRAESAFGSPVLELRRRQVEAYLLAAQDDEAAAAEVLERALGRLPRPVPTAEEVVIGGSPQALPVVVRLATEQLAGLGGGGPAPWRRLAALLPDDPDALALAARRLRDLGLGDEAETLARRAEAARSPAR